MRIKMKFELTVSLINEASCRKVIKIDKLRRRLDPLVVCAIYENVFTTLNMKAQNLRVIPDNVPYRLSKNARAFQRPHIFFHFGRDKIRVGLIIVPKALSPSSMLISFCFFPTCRRTKAKI